MVASATVTDDWVDVGAAVEGGGGGGAAAAAAAGAGCGRGAAAENMDEASCMTRWRT